VRGLAAAVDTVCFPGMHGPSAYPSSLSRLHWLPQHIPAAKLGLVVCLKPQAHNNNSHNNNNNNNNDNDAGLANRYQVLAMQVSSL